MGSPFMCHAIGLWTTALLTAVTVTGASAVAPPRPVTGFTTEAVRASGPSRERPRRSRAVLRSRRLASTSRRTLSRGELEARTDRRLSQGNTPTVIARREADARSTRYTRPRERIRRNKVCSVIPALSLDM